MTEGANDTGGDGRPAVEMRLRPSRAPVTRLSRKVLVGLRTVAAVGIGGALFFALRPQHQTGGSELYNTSNRTTPDGLANLPRDYTDLPHNAPQLGPPLPGDLGRPMVNADTTAPGTPQPAAGPNPEQQRIAQEQEAARTSHLFATTNAGRSVAAVIPAAAALPGAVPNGAGALGLASQDHKLAFLNGDVDQPTVSPDRVEAPASTPVLARSNKARPSSSSRRAMCRLMVDVSTPSDLAARPKLLVLAAAARYLRSLISITGALLAALMQPSDPNHQPDCRLERVVGNGEIERLVL